MGWLDGSTFGMTNSYWLAIGSVVAVGAASEVNKRRQGGGSRSSHAEAQQFWNSLDQAGQQSLLAAATRGR